MLRALPCIHIHDLTVILISVHFTFLLFVNVQPCQKTLIKENKGLFSVPFFYATQTFLIIYFSVTSGYFVDTHTNASMKSLFFCTISSNASLSQTNCSSVHGDTGTYSWVMAAIVLLDYIYKARSASGMPCRCSHRSSS